MKLIHTVLFIVVVLWSYNNASAQLHQEWCIQNATISSLNGQTELYYCEGDSLEDVFRFKVVPFAQPFKYIVTDENNIILRISSSNAINLEGLGEGRLRIRAFAYLGNVTAKVGDDATTAQLATICYALTTNFIPVNGIVPNGGTVSTADGMASVFTCPNDGNSDVISFSTTSTDPLYRYIITDENNIIIAIADGNSFDFDALNASKVRVWGVSYVGEITAQLGDDITTATLASRCFDLSDNFVEINRSKPEGGSVSLTNGNTSEVICSEELEGTTLSFISKNNANNPYAFIVTDENGTILQVLNGSSASFSVTSPGICRVYGVSYTGTLTAKAGDNINTAPLSNDCFDRSDNFVEIIKREVNGGVVSLEDGATSKDICVVEGQTPLLNFLNTSQSEGDSYLYLVTDENNLILSIFTESSINFALIDALKARVWGLSYTGMLLAKVGDNAATTVLSSECYDLSDNFVFINRKAVDGAAISLTSGATTGVACIGDETPDVFSFANTSTSVQSYIYLVTDTNNVVVGLINGHQFDFETIDLTVLRVWGLSYSGMLTVDIGDVATAGALSDDCFDLSNNFVTITRKEIDGGTLSLADNTSSKLVCLGDGVADVLNFVTTSTANAAYNFILTDGNDVILAFITGNAFDFEVAPATPTGTYRIWGLSATGNLSAQLGDKITAIALTDECFELASNFITITRADVDGATVSLASGDTAIIACLGDEQIGSLTFVNTSASPAAYAYLITNEENIIVAISESDAFSFDNLPSGNYRVWGLSYSGDLQAQIGANAATTDLSNECFDLSDNFIAVTQKLVDGGKVSLSNGDTIVAVCGSSATPGPISFARQTNATESYAFVITNLDNRVILVLNGNTVDFNAAALGEYRVWGVSFSGSLLLETGDNLTTVVLSSECYDLSDNFVQLAREEVNGGTLTATNGSNDRFACPGNGKPDLVTFSTTGSSSGAYTFVVTNEQNVIQFFTQATAIDFDTLPEGNYRIWGLAFSGNVLAGIGTDADLGNLTDECFDLSDNFLSVVNEVPNGGLISFQGGDTLRYTCPADGKADILKFATSQTKGRSFVYLITDENNIIEAITAVDSFDFERDTPGINRVWNLAYTGNLTARVGDDAAAISLSDDCFDLSSNFLTVIREIPEGGNVTLQTGETVVFLCVGDTLSDILQFDSTGTSRGAYIYVITDTQNRIQNGISGDRFNFEFIGTGTFRIWGLAYTGNLTARIGDIVTDVPISDDCYDLSDNFTTVVRSQPDGGTVAAFATQTQVTVCLGDGVPDIIEFVNTSTSAAGYGYIITDNQGRFITFSDTAIVDFETINGADTCRVYGVSFVGDILLTAGDMVATSNISSGCFELSDNFITILKQKVDGGTIDSDKGGTTIFTCANDGVADVINFSNTGQGSTGVQYRYVLTNQNNIILGFVNGSQFNFETAGIGTTRVWGVSYTGEFLGGFGTNITQAPLATGCFDLSANFITVSRDVPFGGEVSTASGETDLLFCPSIAVPALQLKTTSNKRVGYVFILTTPANDIISIHSGTSIDFTDVPVGNYRIWGLSYTGDLLAKPGDNLLGVTLASSCHEISANFISVYRSTTIDGGMVFNLNGPDTIYACRDNGNFDIIVLSNDSEAFDAEYRYIITDETNKVLLTELESEVIDFDRADPGIYRVWGVSYTGAFTAIAGDNAAAAMLSDSCYELSSNFIMVVVDTVNGGNIALPNGSTSVIVTVQDMEPGVETFVADSSASILLYRYVITDVNDNILAIATGSTFDFENFEVGNYRVWGIAYTGNFTAQIGDNVNTAILSDECFDLSNDFINVIAGIPFTGGEVQTFTRALAGTAPVSKMSSISLAPNPASERIALRFTIAAPQSAVHQLQLFNLSGQLVEKISAPAAEGDNQIELNIQHLPDGMYLIQLRNGDQMQTQRFLKQ